jgi:aryl-alcohol dehydrogenase-like predicted oxidoreductase
MNGVARLDVVQQRLGLGCARLGSVLGHDRADALLLIRAAFDRGIRFFDTANIYAQGESERILGEALQSCRKQVTIVTKAGQYFPAWMNLAQPLKRIVSPVIRRSSAGRYMVSKAREAPLPQNFSDRVLRGSIESSLRRLNTDYADIVLLHSPPSQVISNGDALGVLDKVRAAGKAVKIGVSCEDVEVALQALDDRRVEVVELPLWPITEAAERFLDRAHRQDVVVIGRGLMSVVSRTAGIDRWSIARAAFVASLSHRQIHRVLVGTTRISHLDQVLDAVESTDIPCL